MKSMTGFGITDFSTTTGAEIHIEIASYNKKQLDVRMSLPHELMSMETVLRKKVTEHISRGSINIKIEVTPSPEELNSFFEVNRELAVSYIKTAEKLQKRLKIAGKININEILNVPGVLKESNNHNTIEETDILQALDAATKQLISMRKKEGDELKKDISSRLKTISKLLKKIKPLTDIIPELQKERLLNNLKNANLEITSDDDRVMKELIIFTDRSDVSEEITRIESHLLQFNRLINKNEPIGRTMEFMLQELQREINTLGTKAAHSEISPTVVMFKTELEKIREQVQNVE